MKRLAAILLTMLMVAGTLMAQVRTPGKQHSPEPLEFHGDGTLYFTVYVNGVIQNHKPSTMVRVTSPIEDNTTVLVEVAENDRLAGKYLHLSRRDAHGLYYVVFANNLVDLYTEYQYDEYLRHNNLHHQYGDHNHTASHSGHSGHNDGHAMNHDTHAHDDHCAVTTSEFRFIVSQIEGETFDDSRLKLARTIFGTHFFTAVQIKTLADKFTFSKNRMEFVQMAYDRCVDKADFFIVLDAFTFKSDKDKLSKFIQRQQRR